VPATATEGRHPQHTEREARTAVTEVPLEDAKLDLLRRVHTYGLKVYGK
jgi:hypothetical protein